jgi:hypothetical protein
MISDKNISVKSLAIGTLSIVITGLALACISTSQLLNTADRVQAQEQERSTAAIRVAAGGGNATAPWTICASKSRNQSRRKYYMALPNRRCC